ncbi:MAG: sulfite exporter TauE/SafE family protein [Chromatiales bacterium]
MDIAYSVAGFAVGFIVGMTGVGGGSLMTPILVLFFHVKPALAVGTDLLYAAITKSGGIWVHNRKGTVHWRVVGMMLVGSMPSSLATVLVLRQLNARGVDYQGAITTALGVALILTSLAILTKGRVIKLARADQFKPLKALHRQLRGPITVICGLMLGVLVTLSSVGAGALGTVMLFFLYPRWGAKRIVGTDIAHAVPLTALAGLGHAHLGSVDYGMLGSLLIGSLPGIYLGSHLGIRMPDAVTRPVLAGMLLLIGVKFAAPVLPFLG